MDRFWFQRMLDEHNWQAAKSKMFLGFRAGGKFIGYLILRVENATTAHRTHRM